ncbi:hypothetical protein, partial [Streptomyces scabiei]
MEPTESVAPDSRLRLRRVSGAWRRGRFLLTGGRPSGGSREDASGRTVVGSGTRTAWPPGRAGANAPGSLVPGP